MTENKTPARDEWNGEKRAEEYANRGQRTNGPIKMQERSAYLTGSRDRAAFDARVLGEVSNAFKRLLEAYCRNEETEIVSRRCVSYREAKEWNEATDIVKRCREALALLNKIGGGKI